MPDAYIGKKVNVWFPYECRTQRILREDSNGLYVSYQGQRVRGRYIGIHPKVKNCWIEIRNGGFIL